MHILPRLITCHRLLRTHAEGAISAKSPQSPQQAQSQRSERGSTEHERNDKLLRSRIDICHRFLDSPEADVAKPVPTSTPARDGRAS